MIRVGIVEDDFRIAQIHEEFSHKVEGVVVVGKALTAKDTLQLLDTVPVDLLLLDVYLPDELGVDLLQQIREKYPQVDIIMITAATDKKMVQKALQYGVLNYIIKPVKIEKFIDAIQSYKKKKNLLEVENEVDQELVDQLFPGSALTTHNSSTVESLPKGIDSLTLEKVQHIIGDEGGGITAEYLGVKMGASRTTARRYLEYLTKVGHVKAEVEYGIVGRPERKYVLVSE
ncbi:response regulator [Bacillus fonticola]|uniref:response regulator n=1 Tax=Bacillus fonticola TaxID=2728853 RepID=UPI0014759610|nr:response regulator [Bacillus fonticola]